MRPHDSRAAARAALTRDIAAFKRRGGKIQRLGPTQFFTLRDDLNPEYAAGRAKGRASQARERRQGRAG